MAITDEESKENKPITSTPLPNGEDSKVILMLHFSSPTKSTEKTPSKTSPKKRNSGHENTSAETEKVLINKTELDNVVYKNAKSLRTIGLEALLDLHAQLSQVVSSYATKLDRTKLPQDLNTIVTRYLQYAKK
ncbi:hypothetical protein HF086_010032 [Spodoptera exigua]|uniref:Uncharacterized protein n=1 Tax=Spodoptera exigua TaxID=7107 RepID=A0A922MLT9_SPOEX|nr:hypothetical protein HF086_010032 [Spodoptera exigua]